MTTDVSAAAWPSTTGQPGTRGNPLESLSPTKLKKVSSATPVMIPGRMSGRSTRRRKAVLPGKSSRSSTNAPGMPTSSEIDHGQQGELDAGEGGIEHGPVVGQHAVPLEGAEPQRPRDDRGVMERVDDHHGERQIDEGEYARSRRPEQGSETVGGAGGTPHAGPPPRTEPIMRSDWPL